MSEEIKYEPVFGNQELFNDVGLFTGIDIITRNVHDGLYRSSRLSDSTPETLRKNPIVAMRRIIKTPVWTIADQKAGRLPEVGSECIYCNGTRPDTVLFVNEKVITLIDTETKDTDTRPRTYTYEEFMQYYKPIETTEERAQRLRSEWVEKAYDDLLANVGIHSTESPEFVKQNLYRVYDTLLSGELQAPKGE